MPEPNRSTLTYRVLRYAPNLIRDEWVNVGVVLEDPHRNLARARLIEQPAEFGRVKRLHSDWDETLLRALPSAFDAELAASDSAAWIEKMEQTLSNALQFSPRKAVVAEDFDAELDRLYHDHVAPPAAPGRGAQAMQGAAGWIRNKLNDVFRRHRILAKMERRIRVEEFTEPGDPLRLDYAYRSNGTRGYVQALSLGRDPAQAKVLAYTAGCIRARQANSEFTAVTEMSPELGNVRHQFIVRLFEAQRIGIVPMPQVEAFAERLRPRLH